MRILTTTLVFCTLVCAKVAFAQPCFGNFTVSTQALVNSLSTCTLITGDLLIIDNGTDPITDLSPLAGLTSIGRDLYIQNTSLTDLSPLSTLTNITRDIRIINNDLLANLGGLENLGMSSVRDLLIQENAILTNFDALASGNLTSVTRNVNIRNNALMTSLGGLINIESIGGNFSIFGLPALTTIGLPLLEYVGNSFTLQNNTTLSTLNFASLAIVGNNMAIINNDALLNLDGFPVLIIIGNSLTIQNNEALEDISALLFLASINGNLFIINNNALPSLDGLQNIDMISGDLTITNNDVLSNCEAICTVINNMSVGGVTTISSNSGLCANITIVDFVCVVLPIELTRFSATPGRDNILLTWETATELNNAGFEIQRSSNDGRDFAAIGWVTGAGTSQTAKTYSFMDRDVKPGINYAYRLMQLDFDGASSVSPVVTASLKGEKFVIGAQYPNPV
ncbi:MAG: hypothetical protein HUU01_16040, partial [Saprospiraceae bacterium]|nr:hypothetical protein [Saprospiraceae bacterium]